MNDHLTVWAAEVHVPRAEAEWLRWIDRAQALFGRSLDGDQSTDGYSIDFAHDAFEAGLTPDAYIASISSTSCPSDVAAAAAPSGAAIQSGALAAPPTPAPTGAPDTLSELPQTSGAPEASPSADTPKAGAPEHPSGGAA